MSYVGERPWWPIQSPRKEGRKEEESKRLIEEREIRSSLLILDLKGGKL